MRRPVRIARFPPPFGGERSCCVELTLLDVDAYHLAWSNCGGEVDGDRTRPAPTVEHAHAGAKVRQEKSAASAALRCDIHSLARPPYPWV
jgi:hypothetical protein